jgi:hypothetical protein
MTDARLHRFLGKIAFGDGCWEWSRGRANGYGAFWNGSRKVYAHRVIYELLVGPIPEGLQIDHLCRNRGCVNPAHMEPVTQRINLLRGATLVAENAAKTHCPRGHPYAPGNLSPSRMKSRGSRECLTCNRETQARRRAARREAAWAL